LIVYALKSGDFSNKTFPIIYIGTRRRRRRRRRR